MKQNRRNFLRTVGIVSFAAILPAGAIAKTKKPNIRARAVVWQKPTL